MKRSFLDKMERKFGKHAIQNLSLYLIICYAFGYIIQMINPNFFNYLTLEPALVLQGQVWRLLTWVVVPPSSSNIFFTLVDANMHEVKLLNPMYITVSVRPDEDQALITPGLLKPP